MGPRLHGMAGRAGESRPNCGVRPDVPTDRRPLSLGRETPDLTVTGGPRVRIPFLQRGVCCEPDALDQVSRLAAAYNRGLLASFSQWAVCQKISLGQDDGD